MFSSTAVWRLPYFSNQFRFHLFEKQLLSSVTIVGGHPSLIFSKSPTCSTIHSRFGLSDSTHGGNRPGPHIVMTRCAKYGLDALCLPPWNEQIRRFRNWRSPDSLCPPNTTNKKSFHSGWIFPPTHTYVRYSVRRFKAAFRALAHAPTLIQPLHSQKPGHTPQDNVTQLTPVAPKKRQLCSTGENLNWAPLGFRLRQFYSWLTLQPEIEKTIQT